VHQGHRQNRQTDELLTIA